MKVAKKEVVNYTLTLTQDEAHWLKGIMQNPIWSSPEDEDSESREFRCNLFHALEWKY